MEKTPPDLRVMVDANILIAGIVWPRWPYEVLQHALRGDYHLVLCEYVIEQARRHIGKRFPNHLDLLEQFLLVCPIELIENPAKDQVIQHGDLVRDITDVPVALAAINAGVDYLVSDDKDLTARYGSTAKLREKLKVLLSGTFLREVMGWKSDRLEEVKSRTWRDLKPPGEV